MNVLILSMKFLEVCVYIDIYDISYAFFFFNLAVLGLIAAQVFSSLVSVDYSQVALPELLIVVAGFLEHRLQL